ncbi:MAG: acylneuraminate cytidylyltransferase [Anaerolineales bacterium]|nr:acylneuraminate cytidylyltransferase [Anaerolineales bacterium]
MKPEILAIVPARGGSKGIPRKNIKPFAGYPLLAWSVAAGLQADSVTRVILSTDDEEIAAVAREFGAETPFLRPVELAQDKTTDLPVFEHALRWLAENEGYHPDVVIQLRPTSPIRPPNLTDEAVRVLLSHPDADCVRGVVPAGQNPHKMWRLSTEGGQMTNLLEVPGIDEPYNAPRQSLPPVHWQTGHIDVIRATTILEKNSMSGDVIYPVEIDPRYTVDIDNLSDWSRYEHLVMTAGLEMVSPGQERRPMPDEIKMLVMDFDGVLTDNRVWVNQEGVEYVAANRSDSYGLSLLCKAGVDAIVISKETDPVVAARCRKMKVPYLQSIDDKESALKELLAEKGIPAEKVVFVGNDINDIPGFKAAGWSVAVADAQPEVIRQADYVLSSSGGRGAVREVCDLILKSLQETK